MCKVALHARATKSRISAAVWNRVDVWVSFRNLRSPALLTEQEVARSWSQIFKKDNIELASFDRAEQLLDELRPESPLRHRLTTELEELRNIHARRVSVAAHN
jgi:hypothetical protein